MTLLQLLATLDSTVQVKVHNRNIAKGVSTTTDLVHKTTVEAHINHYKQFNGLQGDEIVDFLQPRIDTYHYNHDTVDELYIYIQVTSRGLD